MEGHLDCNWGPLDLVAQEVYIGFEEGNGVEKAKKNEGVVVDWEQSRKEEDILFVHTLG